uniref:Uncharacterized protein n=1 Tax=Chlorobium chlorochromatii (strain CaD3) TaxID=340177 RepID=Q3ASP9_CHLCH
MRFNMLYSIESNSQITHIPHHKDFTSWRKRLSDDEYQAIVDDLNSRIDGTEIQTSSWMPGSDWRGTVFQPIYEKACRYSKESSAKFFGLIVWKVFMDRPEWWAFGRYEKDGIQISGITYFKIDPQT